MPIKNTPVEIMPLPLNDTNNALYNLSFVEQCTVIKNWQVNFGGAQAFFSLAEGFDEKDLNKAYRNLAMHFHPDRHQSAKEVTPADDAFKVISSANEHLKFTFLSSHDKAEARTAHQSNPFYNEPPLFSSSFSSGFSSSYNNEDFPFASWFNTGFKPSSFNRSSNQGAPRSKPKTPINQMSYKELIDELHSYYKTLNTAMIARLKILIGQEPSLLNFSFSAKDSFEEPISGRVSWQNNGKLTKNNLFRYITLEHVDFFDWLIEHGQTRLDYDINYILIGFGNTYSNRGILKHVLNHPFIKEKLNIYEVFLAATYYRKLDLASFLFSSYPLKSKSYFIGGDDSTDFFKRLNCKLYFKPDYKENIGSYGLFHPWGTAAELQWLDFLLDCGFSGDLSSSLKLVIACADVTRIKRLISLGATLSVNNWYELFEGVNIDGENFKLARSTLQGDFNTEDAYQQARDILLNHNNDINEIKYINFLKALATTNMSHSKQQQLYKELLFLTFIDNNIDKLPYNSTSSHEFKLALFILEAMPELALQTHNNFWPLHKFLYSAVFYPSVEGLDYKKHINPKLTTFVTKILSLSDEVLTAPLPENTRLLIKAGIYRGIYARKLDEFNLSFAGYQPLHMVACFDNREPSISLLNKLVSLNHDLNSWCEPIYYKWHKKQYKHEFDPDKHCHMTALHLAIRHDQRFAMDLANEPSVNFNLKATTWKNWSLPFGFCARNYQCQLTPLELALEHNSENGVKAVQLRMLNEYIDKREQESEYTSVIQTQMQRFFSYKGGFNRDKKLEAARALKASIYPNGCGTYPSIYKDALSQGRLGKIAAMTKLAEDVYDSTKTRLR